MKNPKQYVKKNNNSKRITSFKYKVILVVFVSLVVLGVYAVREISNLVAERDAQIYRDGYEAGRFDELNQKEIKVDTYKSMDTINEYGELIHSNKTSAEKTLLELARLESGNGEKRKILDTNNRYSLGLYHFQAHTVKDMYKRYYGKKITITEAVKIAENDELSTKLAHDAIFVKGEKFHWKISLCRLEILTKGCLTQAQINKLVLK